MSITKLFEEAQLAEAVYANLVNVASDDELRTALTTGDCNFSAAQAANFVANWQVISHQPNTENGFSATLFKYIGNDLASGFQNGQYVYAIRGTETEWLLNSSYLFTNAANGLVLDICNNLLYQEAA